MSLELDVTGFKELAQRMDSLSQDMQSKVSRAAVSAAVRVIAKEIRRRAPRAESSYWRKRGVKVAPGTLRKSIKVVRSRRESSPGIETWKVSVHSDAFYALFIEFGYYHVPRTKYAGLLTTGTVRSRRAAARAAGRFIAAHPFIRPSFDGSRDAAVMAMFERLRQRIEKAGA